MDLDEIGVAYAADDVIGIIPKKATGMGKPLRVFKKKMKKGEPTKTPSSSTEEDTSKAQGMSVSPESDKSYESPAPGQYRKGGWCLDSTTPETPNTRQL